MSSAERREQLIVVAREVFARRGFAAASIEEIAARAEVSKPVVYEHFGGKEGLYAVIVDREMQAVLGLFTDAVRVERSRVRIEQIALAMLTYVENSPDGFRILLHTSDATEESGPATAASLFNNIASEVEHHLEGEFARHELSIEWAPLYSQMLVGMISMTAQWWLDVRQPPKEVVAAHIVNLAWNGMVGLKEEPKDITPLAFSTTP